MATQTFTRWTCDGPYDPATDDATGACGAQVEDDPNSLPEGWIVSMVGWHLCPRCQR